MNTYIDNIVKSEAFIVKVSGIKYECRDPNRSFGSRRTTGSTTGTPLKNKRGTYKRKNKKDINSLSNGPSTEKDKEILIKNDISSLVTSKYPLNKKDIILSSYISITPVPYYETVEEKINELMNSFIEKNGDPKKDKHFWFRRANIFKYDGWVWRTTKEGIVFKFYRKGCTIDLNQKPLFIGLLLDTKCVGKTHQNIGRYDGNIVFAKECFEENDKLKKWIEKIGLLTN